MAGLCCRSQEGNRAMVRLPRDPDRWTGWHADKAIEAAWRAFSRYEARIDFSLPQEKQDDIYEPYRQCRAQAVEVCNYTEWRKHEANGLP